MKFSEKWLREWVNPPVSVQELAHRLTMSGLEIESIEKATQDFSQVIVGQIVQVEKHPNANKLKVCQVDVGQAPCLTIVCGAANARGGLKVAAALVGAVLPKGLMIQKAKLRGIESFGMLCSAKELGLDEAAVGILELPEDAPLGVSLRDYLNLDDNVIDVTVTPNRGDCLSILGLAREVAAEHGMDFEAPSMLLNTRVLETITDQIDVELEAGCCRYVGRVMKNIRFQSKTPLWMQEKLRRSGIRSINAVVDVMNYVMLELGQPMHAFDLDKLDGKVIVRKAKADETLHLLNGETIKLDPFMTVIADQVKPLALAGIMGGADSSISEQTQHIFLESAYFIPSDVILSGRVQAALGQRIQTDSSYRFERGVDYQLQRKAMDRATQLLLELAGGQAGPVIEKTVENDLMPIPCAIILDTDQVRFILGLAIRDEVIQPILERLGFTIQSREKNAWRVLVPSFRFDIPSDPNLMGLGLTGQSKEMAPVNTIASADMAEEIARIYGYENIPIQPLTVPLALPKAVKPLALSNRLRALLKSRDYQEVVTYSFVNLERLKWFCDDTSRLELSNPISENLAVMRTTLWLSLVETLSQNINRQMDRVRIFEVGSRYTLEKALPAEEKMVSGLVSGAIHAEQWGEPKRPVDFYDLKGDIEALLSVSQDLSEVHFVPMQHRALHPSQSAAVLLRKEKIGFIGMIHPEIARQFNVPESVGLFELRLDPLLQEKKSIYQPVSKYPSIKRDLALVLESGIPEIELEQAIRNEAGALLVDWVVFDVYQGKGVEGSKKSVAFGLTFQHLERTLNVEEVNEVVDRILKLLENKFKARLRG